MAGGTVVGGARQSRPDRETTAGSASRSALPPRPLEVRGFSRIDISDTMPKEGDKRRHVSKHRLEY